MLEELVAVEGELVKRAAAIAEYTNTSIFIPERAENGAEAPPEWFGLNPEDGEDSAEVIDSSGEEEGEAEGGEEEVWSGWPTLARPRHQQQATPNRAGYYWR